MVDYVTLMGSEQVQSAGRSISGAADQMSRAASEISSALERHQRQMDDWLCRFEYIVDKMNEAKEPAP